MWKWVLCAGWLGMGQLGRGPVLGGWAWAADAADGGGGCPWAGLRVEGLGFRAVPGGWAWGGCIGAAGAADGGGGCAWAGTGLGVPRGWAVPCLGAFDSLPEGVADGAIGLGGATPSRQVQPLACQLHRDALGMPAAP